MSLKAFVAEFGRHPRCLFVVETEDESLRKAAKRASVLLADGGVDVDMAPIADADTHARQALENDVDMMAVAGDGEAVQAHLVAMDGADGTHVLRYWLSSEDQAPSKLALDGRWSPATLDQISAADICRHLMAE